MNSGQLTAFLLGGATMLAAQLLAFVGWLLHRDTPKLHIGRR